jgi:hypothetical protein
MTASAPPTSLRRLDSTSAATLVALLGTFDARRDPLAPEAAHRGG